MDSFGFNERKRRHTSPRIANGYDEAPECDFVDRNGMVSIGLRCRKCGEVVRRNMSGQHRRKHLLNEPHGFSLISHDTSFSEEPITKQLRLDLSSPIPVVTNTQPMLDQSTPPSFFELPNETPRRSYPDSIRREHLIHLAGFPDYDESMDEQSHHEVVGPNHVPVQPGTLDNYGPQGDFNYNQESSVWSQENDENLDPQSFYQPPQAFFTENHYSMWTSNYYAFQGGR